MLEVEPGQRMRWRVVPPVVLRRTGPARVHLVAAAGGPLGGDDLELRIRLAEYTELTVGSAGATVAQPGRPGAGPARWTVVAELARGATLRWAPEPTVVCDGAELHSFVRLELGERASALFREEVQLGRHGEVGGRYRGELSVDHAGVPLLRHTTVLDGAHAGLTGPAGTGGYRVAAAVLGAGGCRPPSTIAAGGESAELRWACHQLVGPGWLLLAVGSDREHVRWLLDPIGGAQPSVDNEACRPCLGSAPG